MPERRVPAPGPFSLLQPVLRLNPVTLGAEALRGRAAWPPFAPGTLLYTAGVALLARKARRAPELR